MEKLTIPNNYNIFSHNGLSDCWHKGILYKYNWDETISISSESGSTTYDGKSASDVILLDSDGNQYTGTISSQTITAESGTPDGTYTVFYNLATVQELTLGYGALGIYLGQNNIVCESGGNMDPAVSFDITEEDSSSTTLTHVENFKVAANNEYGEYKPFNSHSKKRFKTGEGFSISFDNPIFNTNFDTYQLNDGAYTIQEVLDNDDETNELTIEYHGCRIPDNSRNDGDIAKQSISMIAETKEVV